MLPAFVASSCSVYVSTINKVLQNILASYRPEAEDKGD